MCFWHPKDLIPETRSQKVSKRLFLTILLGFAQLKIFAGSVCEICKQYF